MNEQLRWLTDRFESHGITHWVESGTLLTLVRSGGLTEYDDIDVAMPSSISQVEEDGYLMQRRSYAGHTYKYQFIPEEGEASRETTGRRLVDVMVFRRHGSHTPGRPSRDSRSRPPCQGWPRSSSTACHSSDATLGRRPARWR